MFYQLDISNEIFLDFSVGIWMWIDDQSSPKEGRDDGRHYRAKAPYILLRSE